jgi:hypothetical protein
MSLYQCLDLLALEVTTSWTIRSMHLTVAIQASTSSKVCTWAGDARIHLSTSDTRTSRTLCMAHTIMTILTEERWTIFKQWSNVRSMRSVAGSTILNNRLMFKQHWASFFSMAKEAGFIQGIFLE